MVTDEDIQAIIDRAEPGVGAAVDRYDVAARYYVASVASPGLQIVTSAGTAQG